MAWLRNATRLIFCTLEHLVCWGVMSAWMPEGLRAWPPEFSMRLPTSAAPNLKCQPKMGQRIGNCFFDIFGWNFCEKFGCPTWLWWDRARVWRGGGVWRGPWACKRCYRNEERGRWWQSGRGGGVWDCRKRSERSSERPGRSRKNLPPFWKNLNRPCLVL